MQFSLCCCVFCRSRRNNAEYWLDGAKGLAEPSGCRGFWETRSTEARSVRQSNLRQRRLSSCTEGSVGVESQAARSSWVYSSAVHRRRDTAQQRFSVFSLCLSLSLSLFVSSFHSLYLLFVLNLVIFSFVLRHLSLLGLRSDQLRYSFQPQVICVVWLMFRIIWFLWTESLHDEDRQQTNGPSSGTDDLRCSSRWCPRRTWSKVEEVSHTIQMNRN